MSQKTLAELQIALQDFLLNKCPYAGELTLATPKFSTKARLDIYHSAYRLRLLDTLRNDYPALAAYLGDEVFINIASDYIAQHPSNHPSLRWLGEKLPAFLHAHAHWKNMIVAKELAEFEWAQTMAFDAADAPLATLNDVLRLQPEQWLQLQLAFHPSLQLACSYSNAPELWNSLVKNKTTITIETTHEAKAWLIWRENLQVVYRPLENSEYWALKEFIKQANFSDICNGLCEWFTEEKVPALAAQYLQQWIRGGLVSHILTAPLNSLT